MNTKEKILLVQLLLEDIRANWGWENDGGFGGRATKARDLCVEIAGELGDNNYTILSNCCDEYINDDYGDRDGRYFRQPFPYGYENMSVLHGLGETYADKSEDFKRIAKEYLTHPEYRFEDWQKEYRFDN